MLIPLPVITHGGNIDGALDILQGDTGQGLIVTPIRCDRRRLLGRCVLRQDRTGRGLENGQRLARIRSGHAHDLLTSIIIDDDLAVQSALVDDCTIHQCADRIGAQRLKGEQQGSGQERRDHGETRVLRGGGDEGDPAILDAGQQGILLGAREAVNLIDEEHGLLAAGEPAPGIRHDLADVLDPCAHRRQFDEAASAAPGDEIGQGRLPRTRRPPQDNARHTRAALLTLGHVDEAAQRRPGCEQMILTDDLIQGARTHAHGQRSAGVHRKSGIVCSGALEQVHTRRP